MNKRLTICAEDIIETAKLGISEADKIAKIRALVAKFTESCVPTIIQLFLDEHGLGNEH